MLRANYDLRPGGLYVVRSTPEMQAQGAPDVLIDGEVLECDPPTRLVQTWRAFFTPETAAEGFTRLTWELDEEQPGVTRLTVTHDVDRRAERRGRDNERREAARRRRRLGLDPQRSQDVAGEWAGDQLIRGSAGLYKHGTAPPRRRGRLVLEARVRIAGER